MLILCNAANRSDQHDNAFVSKPPYSPDLAPLQCNTKQRMKLGEQQYTDSDISSD